MPMADRPTLPASSELRSARLAATMCLALQHKPFTALRYWIVHCSKG